MRPLEIILLLTLLPPILFLFFPIQKPKWVNALPIGGLLLLIFHLIFEGIRWQMVPAYVLTAVLAIVGLRPLLEPQTSFKKRWGWAILFGILGLLFWLISLALPVALPVPKLMAATGNFDVSTTILHLIDENRPETYTENPDDNRELIAQIWYPVTDTAEARKAIYLPALDVIGPVVAEQFELPAFLFNHINLTQLDIYRGYTCSHGANPFSCDYFFAWADWFTHPKYGDVSRACQSRLHCWGCGPRLMAMRFRLS